MKTEHKHQILLALAWLSIPFAIWYSLHIDDWTWLGISYLISQFNKVIGNNISCHRYFTHRNFKTTPFKHKLLCFWPILLINKSPIAYAMNHRHHHLYADSDQDTHSPVKNFWQTITGIWEFRGYKWFADRGVEFRVKDLMRDPTLRFIERHYFKIWYFLILGTLLIDWRVTLFALLLPAGWYHLTANVFVSGMDHLKIPGSYRTYETPDNSQNNHVLAWVTLGEGYHNNHHRDPSKYDQAFRKGEYDICAWFVRTFFEAKEGTGKKIYNW